MVIALVFMLVVWVIGRYLNHRKANKWLKSLTPTLKAQFPKVQDIEFDDTTSATFEVILSGRSNIAYMRMLLALE